MKYDESHQMTGSSLESSKGFFKGSRSPLTVHTSHVPKSMKIPSNPIKSDQGAQMTSSQPGIEQRFPLGQEVTSYRPNIPCSKISKTMDIYEIYVNQGDSSRTVKIY